MNLKIPRKLIFCACGCGELLEDRGAQGKPTRYIFGHRNRGVVWISGEKHPNWKGGIRKMTNDYITILNPSHKFATKQGYIPEHRLVWERANSAILLPWGVVHHINHKRDDNRIENLVAMTKVEHDRLESYNRKRIKGSFV